MPRRAPENEASIRSYLLYLKDPDGLVDRAAVTRAERQVERETDPIRKLRALSRLELAGRVDGDALRADFIANVGAWLEANPDVTVGAFRASGVPDEVLVEAGLVDAHHRNGSRPVPAQPSRPPRRPRAAPIPLDQAADVVPEGTFRVNEYAVIIGRQVSTARLYIDRLIRAGVLVDAGEVEDWSGSGSPPKLYKRAPNRPPTEGTS